MSFADYTIESAPPGSRRAMEGIVKHLGFMPVATARLAASPQLLNGFMQISGLFETTTLPPVAREVVIMTIATRNRCHLCVAMHSAKLTELDAGAELIMALREQRSPADPALAALRTFTLEVLATSGAVTDAALKAFLAHGYTEQNALEVVLGIGAYTLSTLANRLTGAPLDEPLAPFAWTEPAATRTNQTDLGVLERI